MTIEQLRRDGLIIYECVVGSHIYGTNKEGSDIDIKGVYIAPISDVLSNSIIPQVSDEKQDTTFYEIGRFIELLSDANPNMLDILGSDMVIYEDPIFRGYFPDPTMFLTKKLKHTFGGYARSQVMKAKGFNKKVNWEKSRIERRGVLDFCYVFKRGEESFKYKTLEIPDKNIGLASVNNAPNIYSMYVLRDGTGGIVGDNSNDVQTRSIPKGSEFIGFLRFDREAYSTHCKDYGEYQEWLKKRNPLRYADNLKVGNEFDSKNMMHCVRLMLTLADVMSGRGLILRRPEREYLLGIRNGEVTYEEILARVEELEVIIGDLYETCDLPRGVNIRDMKNLLIRIRMDSLKQLA